MFRDKFSSRSSSWRGSYRFSGSRFSRSRGSQLVGRVGRSEVTKSAGDRKLESAKLRLGAKNIPLDQMKTKKKLREDMQDLKAKNPSSDAEAMQTEDVQLYKQKIAVTPDPERKCNENEIEKIQEALLDALEPLEDGCYPQFYGSYTVKGVLVMACANEQTKEWLERVVPKLQPWEGGKLCAKPKGEVAQGIKVQFKTPKLFAKTDPKKILQMLSTQNKTLETNYWKNVSVKSEDSGQTLVYVVDNASIEAIRALNNKAYLGLGNVELVILKNEKESAATDKTPSQKTTEETPKEETTEETPKEETTEETPKEEKTEETPTEETTGETPTGETTGETPTGETKEDPPTEKTDETPTQKTTDETPTQKTEV